MATIKTGKSCDSMMTSNTQQQDYQQQDYQDTSSSTIIKDHYYYNRANGAGRVRPPIGTPVQATPQEFEQIREAYVDNIGPLTAAVARMIEQAMQHGLTVEEVLMAIEETGFAPRPTAWYLRAILEAWAENGVTVSKIRHKISVNAGTCWWKKD